MTPDEIAIRKDERERCAKIALAHKGSYARRPRYKSILQGADAEMLLEIRAEERGEDIAAGMIAEAILNAEESAS